MKHLNYVSLYMGQWHDTPGLFNFCKYNLAIIWLIYFFLFFGTVNNNSKNVNTTP